MPAGHRLPFQRGLQRWEGRTPQWEEGQHGSPLNQRIVYRVTEPRVPYSTVCCASV